MPETGGTDDEWEGWKSLAARGTGGWQPSQCGVKVVKQELAASLKVPHMPLGEDEGAHPALKFVNFWPLWFYIR